jgi:drug/metabolite transporter (DMT)-like permease
MVVLSSLFYGSYGIWMKLMGGSFGNFTQAVLRSIIVSACLLTLALGFKQLTHMHWRRDAKWLLLSGLSSIFISAPIYYATQKGGVGLPTTLGYIGIVLGMFIFGWLFGHERFTKNKFFSTLLGLVGLWLVFTPNLRSAGFLALAAAFVSGVATGLNVVISKRLPYSVLQTALITWTGSILSNLPFIFIFRETAPLAAWSSGWLYLGISAGTALVASWAVIKGVKLIEAGAAGILGLLEVVFAIVFGVALFGERPDVITLLGAACVMAAAAIPYIQHYNAAKGRLE